MSFPIVKIYILGDYAAIGFRFKEEFGFRLIDVIRHKFNGSENFIYLLEFGSIGVSIYSILIYLKVLFYLNVYFNKRVIYYLKFFYFYEHEK